MAIAFNLHKFIRHTLVELTDNDPTRVTPPMTVAIEDWCNTNVQDYYRWGDVKTLVTYVTEQTDKLITTG
jgi:hypothetical protein